jgi:hypothetical protein
VTDQAPDPPPPEPPLDPVTAEHLASVERAVDTAMRRRRFLLIGYGLALVALVVGIPLALWVAGQAPGGEMAWVFFVPPAVAGVVMWGANWLVKRVH